MGPCRLQSCRTVRKLMSEPLSEHACSFLYSPQPTIPVMPKIVVQGRTFYYEEVGSQGDPLVFLSGLGGDHRAFSRPQRYFGTKFRALAFDARDVGQSDRVDHPYTTADMADDVAGWLEAIGASAGARAGSIAGGPGRAGAGLAPSSAGQEPGAGFDARRRRTPGARR